MSNEVNFSKMYQFIASFNQGEQTWVDTADTNDNGIVSKAEFKKFVNENFAEWNGEEGGMPDADLINKFWSSLDTTKGGKTNRVANTNNLHANEIEAMNRKLDAYVTLGTFVEQNVKAPDFINNQAGWLRDVESDLSAIVENLIKSGNIDDLETELTNALPQVQNKVTAEYVVFEYQESLKDSLNDYPDYNISEDETLNKIISNYLLNLEGTEEPEDIETDIKDIIDAYLATAGLKENNNYSLDELSENEGNALNPLQKEVIKKGLKEANTNNMDELLTQVFGDISLDETTKQEFITMLNEILDSAVDAFVETLTVADIQEGQPITTSKAFDAQAYITSEMKAPIVEKHYLGKASEVIDKFADELVNGIKDNSATLNVYNASKGEIKLDKASARALIVELDSAAKEFVKNYLATNETYTDFDADLKTFLTDYLTGKGKADAKAGLEAMQENVGISVSNEELAQYKEACITNVGLLLQHTKTAKLGSADIDLTNYKDAINSYTDGNKLYDDIEALIASIDTSSRIYTLAEAAEEVLEAVDIENMNQASAFDELKDIVDYIIDRKMPTIIGDNTTMHTEFGIDANGNIVFQNEKVTEIYNRLKASVKEQLESTEVGKKALELLGEANVNRLIQAAWIMTYNDFNSSQSNDASDFIAKVLNNLQMILDKVQESPEMLAIFTMAPNYANASVVTDVEHYGTNTTAGGDQVILYGGTVTTDENGVVHIDNKNDDPDYQATMNDLLRNLKERYSMLPSDVVEKIFREAQRQALATAQNNIEDCPNGTGKSAGSLRDSTKDWSGAESRSGDEFRIDMDQLVELTLYNFDKLLYSNMALTEDKMNLTNMSDIKIDWTEIENSSNKAQLNTIKDKSFADIMKDGTDLVPISGTWSTSIDEVKTIAKNRITELIEGISSALIKAGFNEDNVKKVAISVASYYKAAIDAVTDQVDRGDKGENKLTMSFKYKDVNGNEVQVTGAEYYQKEYKFTDSAKYGTTTSYNNSVNYTGLKLSESYKDTNHYILYLQVNEVLERFQDFYNAL